MIHAIPLIVTVIIFIVVASCLSRHRQRIDQALDEEATKLAYWRMLLNDAKQRARR